MTPMWPDARFSRRRILCESNFNDFCNKQEPKTNPTRSTATQETRVTSGTTSEKKNVFIQTAPIDVTEYSGMKITEETDGKIVANISRSTVSLRDKRSSKFWSADDEPAPQWLIEEALNRGTEFGKNSRLDKTDHSADVNEGISLKLRYEAIISEFEEKLSNAKAELEATLKKRCTLKDKYKRALRNVKLEANKENELLQEKIVQICTSVLEKFGPYAFNGRKGNNGNSKSHKVFKCYGKLSKKLHRKLGIAIMTSNKLKQELALTKQSLDGKIKQYDSLDKSFSRLKQELETTEISLNDLINENSSLRKKFEDTREWMELKIGKDRHERCNNMQLKDMQRSRELVNLKRKAEEDFTIITQLRNKLLRSESANANKGFLLNSYKGQLADLVKENEQALAKYKESECEISQLRNTNAQLKAKISLLNNEKEKLLSESEKSETDIKERMETKLTLKYEQSMLHDMDMMKSKCDEVLAVMRTRMNSSENCSAEYSAAITEFLKKVCNHFGERDAESALSEGEAGQREAHETACNILNMTPGQLSGFMKGRPANTINAWLSDFHRITSRSNFADALAKYLFKKISTGSK